MKVAEVNSVVGCGSLRNQAYPHSHTSAKNYPASDTATLNLRPLRPVRPELRPLRPLRPVRPELRLLRPVRPELSGNARSNSMRPEFPRNAGSHPMPSGPCCELLCVRLGGCFIAAS